MITVLSFMAVAYVPALAGGGLAFGIAAYPFYLFFTPLITGDIKIFSGTRRSSKASFDQDGWNWSEKPAVLRHKTFKYLIEYLDR